MIFFMSAHFSATLARHGGKGGVLNLAALDLLMLLCVSVWASLSGVTGKHYLGNFKDSLTATLGCVNILCKYSHLAMSVGRAKTGCSPPCRALLSGEAFLRDAQAGFTKRPSAGVFVLIFESVSNKSACPRKYVLHL